MSVVSYLGLGSNIEPKLNHLKIAVEALSEADGVTVSGQSSIYATAPMGFVDQDPFLNAVVEIDTDLDPFALLTVCSRIERRMGRKREIRWGPRVIDVDILIFGDEVVDSPPELVVPHGEMLRRAFVLVPLAELNAQQRVHGVSVQEHLRKLAASGQEVEKWLEADRW